MTHGTPAWLDELLTLLVKRIAAATNRPADAVFLSLFPDDWHLRFPPADRFVTARPVAGSVDQRGVTGGGRVTTGFDAKVRVAMFSRLENEQDGRHTRTLSKVSENVLKEFRLIVEVLQLWEPVRPNALTACLLKEPMRIDPGFTVVPRSDPSGSPWVVVESSWEMSFRSDLTATIPAG